MWSDWIHAIASSSAQTQYNCLQDSEVNLFSKFRHEALKKIILSKRGVCSNPRPLSGQVYAISDLIEIKRLLINNYNLCGMT